MNNILQMTEHGDKHKRMKKASNSDTSILNSKILRKHGPQILDRWGESGLRSERQATGGEGFSQALGESRAHKTQ